MEEISFEEVEGIVSGKEFEKLVDKFEGQHLEVKGASAYDITQITTKYELAKDLSAFANSDGGFIIIGMTHRQSSEVKRDIVAGFDYLDDGQVEASQIRQVLNKHIYPKIKEPSINWIQHGEDSAKGVLVIKIPPQSNSDKPFLITKIAEESEQLQGYILGMAERQGDSNLPLSPASMHEVLKRGFSKEIDRLISIETKLDRISDQTTENNVPRASDLLDERADECELSE